MINFAIVQFTKKHTEIFGTFIEIILRNKWNITIYYDLEKDDYTFLPYYLDLFEFSIPIRPIKFLLENVSQIQYFIFTSASDNNYLPEEFKNSSLLLKKSIFIHHQYFHFQSYMLKNIILSPIIRSSDLTKATYILPIYKSYKKLHWKLNPKTIFAIIGGIRGNNSGTIFDRDINLIIEVLNKFPKLDFEFRFFMRKWDWIWVCKRFPIIKKHPKIKGFPSLPTKELIHHLHSIKFILPLAKKNGWFHNQRLTGSIPLAINLNIPLILDNTLADIYDLKNSSICYENSLIEIIENVVNLPNSDYYNYIQKLVLLKKEITKNNEKQFINICLTKI